ncbi:hypothetical protein VTH06DRAFT_6168 [Thermothelomyces fergusii]
MSDDHDDHDDSLSYRNDGTSKAPMPIDLMLRPNPPGPPRSFAYEHPPSTELQSTQLPDPSPSEKRDADDAGQSRT